MREVNFSGISLVLAMMLASACTGMVSRSVDESEKDPTYSHDGNYRAIVDSPGGRQTFESKWYTDCRPLQMNAGFTVTQSVLSWPQSDDPPATTFVGSEGEFRLEIDSDGVMKGRGATMSDGRIKVILQGDLRPDEMVGFLVIGVRQFNYQGCSYRMQLRKI